MKGIEFHAVVQAVRTVRDGGFVLVLAAGKEATDEFKELMGLQGEPVQVACIPLPPAPLPSRRETRNFDEDPE